MADELDQDQLKLHIENLNVDLRNELQLWELGGIDPGNISVNGFLQDVWIFAIRDFLVEKGLIDDLEFTAFYKERLLSKLKEMRPVCMKAVEEAKRQIMSSPGIIGPSGQPL